jgi:hypothetical protein
MAICNTFFFQMMERARSDFNNNFFMETFIIATWQISKQRNGLIFDNCPANVSLWKRNFKEEWLNQAHRMKDSLKTPFLSWVNSAM